MAINHKYKTIFVHIPKTAGTSMERKEFVGLPGADCHDSINKFKERVTNPDEYFKWCFSRNPYDRLVSAYVWGITNHKEEFLKDIDSFEDYINKIEDFYEFGGDSLDQKRSGVHTIPQSVFINNNISNMDFIGKFENLNVDFNYVCEKIEEHSSNPIINKDLPISKKTTHNHYETFYNEEIIKKVNILYKKDFELFDYKML